MRGARALTTTLVVWLSSCGGEAAPPVPGTRQRDPSPPRITLPRGPSAQLDVDGDGYADVIAAGTQGDCDRGIYLLRGGPDGPAAPRRALTAPGAGLWLRSAREVTGDTRTDVLLGVTARDGASHVELIAGAPDGLSAEPSARLLDTYDADVDGVRPATAVGDVDGDGANDVVVPRSHAVLHRGLTGGGLDREPGWLAGPGALVAEGVGDVDGDGLGDVVLLAGETVTDTGQPLGEQYLFLGRRGTGLALSADVVLPASHVPVVLAQHFAGIDLDADGHSDLVRRFGREGSVGGQTGPVAFLGGPDGLSYDRFAATLGAPACDAARSGSCSGAIATGDLNADGYGDVAISSVETGVAVFLGGPGGWSSTEPVVGLTYPEPLPGGRGLTGYGNAISIPGDIDGDGFHDLVVGAAHAGGDGSGGGCSPGALYVHRGDARGIRTRPDWIIRGEAGQALGWVLAR